MGLFSHPLLTLKVLGILLGRLIKGTLNFAIKHYLAIISLVAAIAGFRFAPGPHENVKDSSLKSLLV